MTYVNARPSTRAIDEQYGHHVHGTIVYNDQEKVCHDVTSNVRDGDWRTRANAKSVKVKHTKVDTLSCM